MIIISMKYQSDSNKKLQTATIIIEFHGNVKKIFLLLQKQLFSNEKQLQSITARNTIVWTEHHLKKCPQTSIHDFSTSHIIEPARVSRLLT